MQALSGTFGSLLMPGTPYVPIGELRQWDMTADADLYDASVLGDTWRERVSGLKQWGGTAAGYYALVDDITGQRVLYNALVNNNSVVLVMQTKQGGGSFEGTAFLTQCAVSNPVDGLITINFAFTGTGSLQVNF